MTTTKKIKVTNYERLEQLFDCEHLDKFPNVCIKYYTLKNEEKEIFEITLRLPESKDIEKTWKDLKIFLNS